MQIEHNVVEDINFDYGSGRRSCKERDISKLLIAYWNIEGLSLKLKFKDFLNYLGSHNMFALAETWEELNDESKYILETHSSIFLPAIKKAQHGRAMA